MLATHNHSTNTVFILGVYTLRIQYVRGISLAWESTLFISLHGGPCDAWVRDTKPRVAFILCLLNAWMKHFPRVLHNNLVRWTGRTEIIYSFVHKEIRFKCNVTSAKSHS